MMRLRTCWSQGSSRIVLSFSEPMCSSLISLTSRRIACSVSALWKPWSWPLDHCLTIAKSVCSCPVQSSQVCWHILWSAGYKNQRTLLGAALLLCKQNTNWTIATHANLLAYFMCLRCSEVILEKICLASLWCCYYSWITQRGFFILRHSPRQHVNVCILRQRDCW